MQTSQTILPPLAACARFKIEADVAPRVNLAFQQNGAPVLRGLKITCLAGGPYENLTLKLRAEPKDVATDFERVIAAMKPGDIIDVPPKEVRLRPGVLANLTEARRAEFLIELFDGEALLASDVISFELLAFNEWVGATEGVELLAAFVTPNDPVVGEILRRAARILSHQGSQSIAIDGYLSGSRSNVWAITSAIWSAVQSKALVYALPPASFEQRGQKVRLPGTIASGGVGTCLDLSVLFAAALEQAGLNPFIVLVKGHAFPGVWLKPGAFPSIFVDELDAVRSAIARDDAIVFESTLAAKPNRARFSAAVIEARARLSLDREREFVGVLDVQRARMSAIRPLGAVIDDAEPDPSRPDEPSPFETAPDLPDFNPISASDTPKGRLETWKRKLLDLSARNPLLNLKHGPTVFEIIGERPGAVVKALDDREAFKLRPMPDKLRASGSGGSTASSTLVDIARYIDVALKSRELVVEEDERSLTKRLTRLLRAARADLRETGLGTVYLAAGFLEWRKSAHDTQTFRAPLILVPLTLSRFSSASPIQLHRGEDDAIFNPTLVHFLRQEYDCDLSAFESVVARAGADLDVDSVLHGVAQAVGEARGFVVLKTTAVARFSFAKQLMWFDLVAREATIRNHPVIGRLLGDASAPLPDAARFTPVDALDRTLDLTTWMTPLSADSSQIQAIRAAAEGRSFVLVGPPGTGKSQTIANMIAQLLAEGKRVLFVAEKIAALEVVHRRLTGAGLGDLCLELHSNTIDRNHVLAQLERAWRSAETPPPVDFAAAAENLSEARARLLAEQGALHSMGDDGRTSFQALGAAVLGGRLARFPTPDLGRKSARADRRRRLMDSAARLQRFALAVGGPRSATHRGVARQAWTPELDLRLRNAAARLEAAVDALDDLWLAASNALAFDSRWRSKAGVDAVVRLIRALHDLSRRTIAKGTDPSIYAMSDRLVQAVDILRRRRALLSGDSALFHAAVVERLDLARLNAAWFAARSDSVRDQLLRAGVRAALTLAAGGRAPIDVPADLARLDEIAEITNTLSAFDDLRGVIGWAWRGAATSPKSLERLAAVASFANAFEAGLDGGRPDQKRVERLRERLRSTRASSRRARLEAAAADYDAAVQAIEAVALAPIGDLVGPDAGDWFSAVRALARRWRDESGELASWCAWRRARLDGQQHGLGAAIAALEAGALRPEEVQFAVEVNDARRRLAGDYEARGALSSFSRPDAEDARAAFRDADERHRRLAADAVKASLSGRAPAYDDPELAAAWASLRRELKKKSKQRSSVRQLLHDSGEAIAALTPCFLMSPMSAAQFLSRDDPAFDVVIIDEASQIPVWDAAGVLARGRQAIVVGDPKQLPPTNFFQRGESEAEEDAFEIEDLESVLDECLAAGLPTLRLAWHYRSRSDRLISFSNERHYDGGLVTFPAPLTDDQSVRLVRVAGVYERGENQTNLVEARAVVDEVMRRLTSPDPKVRGASIGVITLNVKQQALIEGLLEDALAADEAFEDLIDAEGERAVFVKNLESVQGDERDVILISIGYGPDAAGKMSMNFGPMNKSGGERRLNVAATRARNEMIVFASLDPEDIDLGRTRAQGVADLRALLDYARRGGVANRLLVEARDRDAFADAIAEHLVGQGWRIARDVGVGAARIAIAVEDPSRPGAYLAAIETDGSAYLGGSIVRDRELLRPDVLGDLGWRLVRVWAADWFMDPDGARRRLDAALAAWTPQVLDVEVLDVEVLDAPPPLRLDHQPETALSASATRKQGLASWLHRAAIRK